MALDNHWFQSWGPTSNLVPFYETPLKNLTTFQQKEDLNDFHDKDKSHVTNMLPFLLSLSLNHPPTPNTRNRKSSKYTNLTIEEHTGPFRTVYAWSQLDFKYPSQQDRNIAIIQKDFIPENNLPLGVDVYKDRIFVTMPKWKNGVPATLAVLPRKNRERSPALVPYPSWEWHIAGSCYGLTSVFRVQTDTCGRIWVLDSGQIDVTTSPKQICHPTIYIFDLATDKLILRYELPKEFIKEDSLYSNIVVDHRSDDCENAHAYLTDVWRFGLVVFSLEKQRSWRVTDHLFFPDPLAAAYDVRGLKFQWTDGIFGLSLGPINKKTDDRLLYFHPMSSFREFYVLTSVICNETGWSQYDNAFKVIGQSRGASGHVSASAIDRRGIMFYNLVTRDSVGCWDTRKPYKRANLGLVAQNKETLVFPNDLKIDNDRRQSLWIITNKLPFYLYKGLDKNKINFRVMTAYADEAMRDTICDPEVAFPDTFLKHHEEEDCY